MTWRPLNVPGVKQLLLSMCLPAAAFQVQVPLPARESPMAPARGNNPPFFQLDFVACEYLDFLYKKLGRNGQVTFHNPLEEYSSGISIVSLQGGKARGSINGRAPFCIIQLYGHVVVLQTDQHKNCQFGTRTNHHLLPFFV